MNELLYIPVSLEWTETAGRVALVLYKQSIHCDYY